VIRPEERERRREIFRRVAPIFGTVRPASLLRDAARFGSLLRSPGEGIFKPQWATHALSIASMLSSPYTDQITFLEDRSWLMAYSPKSGGLDIAANVALLNCMQDREPLLVLRQQTDKRSRSGSTYLIAGLGHIERYDARRDVFQLRGLHFEEVVRYIYGQPDLADDLVETAIRLEALEDWTPVVQEERAIYHVNRLKRDAPFRDVILSNYGCSCAVTGLRFRHGSHIEAEAAHIIGKNAHGPDDPRNGLALSRTAHWAFDHGIFTLSDDYEVLIHDQARDGDQRLKSIFETEGKQILLPNEAFYRPHPSALAWHRQHRFGAFLRE
jgi:HNH endonuclease